MSWRTALTAAAGGGEAALLNLTNYTVEWGSGEGWWAAPSPAVAIRAAAA